MFIYFCRGSEIVKTEMTENIEPITFGKMI